MDKFCYKYSDYNWDISSEMLLEKNKYFINNEKILKNLLQKTINVPVGIWNIKNSYRSLSKKIKFIYIGHFVKRSGIFEQITFIDYLKKDGIDAHLTMIGGGDIIEVVKDKVNKLKLQNDIKIINWIDKKNLYKYIENSHFAFALYHNDIMTKFCFPTKIIDYISVSTPVLTNHNNYLGEIVSKSGAGFEINSYEDLKKILISMKSDKLLYQECLNKTHELSKNYLWNNIFAKAYNWDKN